MENIYKKFGKIEALKDVSWEANEERLALLGHNGAGKSTTFGLLSAQLNQDAGYLYIEKRHHKPYENTLSSSGICYQDDSLW
jgi:ABC-type multidrug transport system ATPase subunit